MKHSILLAPLCAILLASIGFYVTHPSTPAEPAPPQPAAASTTPPSTFPLTQLEAPITTFSSPDYPGTLCADFVLHDLTDSLDHRLSDHPSEDFLLAANHDYTIELQLQSDGDPLTDLQLTAELPSTASNPSRSCLRFHVSDASNDQLLLAAWLHLTTDGETLDLQPTSDDSADLLDPNRGRSLASVGTDPLSLSFAFRTTSP